MIKKFFDSLRPADFVIFLLIIFLLFKVMYPRKNHSSEILKVIARENEYYFSLSKDGIYQVSGEKGITEFEIKNNTFKILSAPCANKNCMHQPTEGTVICLPNKVFFLTENPEGFDEISR